MRLESSFWIAPNWLYIEKTAMALQFFDMASLSNVFDFILFFLSSLVTGPSLMSVSSLVLELWQFSFVRDWPEIWKSEIPPSEFPISIDWGKLRIPNLERMSLIKYYWRLQNTRVTAFTISELLRENQQWEGGGHNIPSPRLGLKGGFKTGERLIWCCGTEMSTVWSFFYDIEKSCT